MKSVVASVGQVSSSNSNNKSWSSSSDVSKKSGSGSSSGGAHTICFSIKQRRDQEVTLPATSFPLESSSSEEDLDDLEEEERERRAQEREERRKWRKMKREQFEKERREKKEKDDRAKRQEEEKRLKQEKETLKLKELEEQENASGDEEMYDIFKYGKGTNYGRRDFTVFFMEQELLTQFLLVMDCNFLCSWLFIDEPARALGRTIFNLW